MISIEILLMLSIIVTALLLFMSVYFMITLSDLESDYINRFDYCLKKILFYWLFNHFSIDCCSRLNRITIPRLICLVLHSLLLLPQMSWIMLTLSLPLTGWQVWKQLKVGSGDFGLFDPTKIVVRENLQGSIKESLVYMGYHLFSFFIYMWQLVTLLSPDPSSGKPLPHSEVPWWKCFNVHIDIAPLYKFVMNFQIKCQV